MRTLLHRGERGLGFSIAGGVGAAPYIENDEVSPQMTLFAVCVIFVVMKEKSRESHVAVDGVADSK